MKKNFFYFISIFFFIINLVLAIDDIANHSHTFYIKYPSYAIENNNPIKENKPNNIIDNKPPLIELVTKELTEGKNVFKVKISDQSSLKFSEINYVKDGKIKLESLVNDKNNIYKALISVHTPSVVIVINAGDIYGNTASFSKSIKVNPPSDIFSQILKYFSDFFY